MQFNRATKFGNLALLTALCALVLASCEKKAALKPGDVGAPLSVAPDTQAVLTLMPEKSIVALAIPSVKRTEDQVVAMLKRGAPANMDMDAELKVIISQLARGANAFEAQSVADIAAIKGLDPEAPMAFFFAARPPESAPPSPPGQMELERQLLSYLGITSVAPMVTVMPYSKRQDAEKFVVDWGGPGTMNATDLTDIKTTLFARDDGSFAYFFTDSLLVAGTSVDLVKGVAARIKSPATIRYGTPECPADNADEIVQLIRTDKMPKAETTMRMPGGPMDALTQLWSGWVEPYTGDDPMVVTWHFANDRLVMRSRLDYAEHPGAKSALAPPAPLEHVNALPKSTLGAWSMQITPQTRATLKDTASANLSSQGGGLLAQMGDSLGKIIDLTGEEATLAITGPGADTTNLALLIDFQDGEAARNMMRELGMTPLKAETYNNTDIYTFVYPPTTVYYAVPKSTFVLAGKLDTVKTLIDTVSSGKPTNFATSLDPPLDTTTARQQAFIAMGDLFTGALAPTMESFGMAAKEQTQMAAKVFEKVRDARLTTEVVNDWQDTRLIVQFD